MKTLWSIALLTIVVLASCAKDSGVGSGVPTERTGARIMDDQTWLAEKTKDNGYKQDSSGNWLAKTNKRSSFENQSDSPYFKGDLAKKGYKTGDYARKSWWGNKNYGAKKYEGSTDGSRFMTTSRDAGKGARESGSSAGLDTNYQTGAYGTGAAREAGRAGLDKPSDAETDSRRNQYIAPEIIDWRQQRSMDISQSKSLLGR